MVPPSDTQPAWLFSFVDLAFLLLIAMTQLAGDTGALALDLGEVLVPRIGAGSTTDLPAASSTLWQVRVRPAASAHDTPFAVQPPGDAARALAAPDAAAPTELDAEGLRARLAELRAHGAARPLLVPDADARTQDTLDAVDALESQWPGRRRATVSPVFARP